MVMANTVFTRKSTCLALGTFGRCQASKVDHPITSLRFSSKIKNKRLSVPEQNLGLRFQNDATRRMNMAGYAGTPPVDPPSDHWKVWILGAIFTILLSFTRRKWGPLLRLKEKVETTIDEAQHVVDIVEEVAERVDKVAEGAAKHLPKGKLRDSAEFVEKVAEDIDKRAESVEDALDKVENMEEELESFIESNTHHENAVTTTEAKEQKK